MSSPSKQELSVTCQPQVVEPPLEVPSKLDVEGPASRRATTLLVKRSITSRFGCLGTVTLTSPASAKATNGARIAHATKPITSIYAGTIKIRP